MALTEDVYYSLRVGLVSLLDGNITQNSQPIPVYGNLNAIGGNKYILIQNVANVDNSHKTGIVTRTTMQVSIVCKGDTLNGNEHEDIGAQVLAILAPYPSKAIPINSNFGITDVKVVSDTAMPVRGGNTTTLTLERHLMIEFIVNNRLRTI
jgi:hypothetical protein